MPRNSAPLKQDDPPMRDVLQSLVLDLVATHPVRALGNAIWQIYDRLTSWWDALIRFGTKSTAFERAALSKIYLLAESVSGERFFQPPSSDAALALSLPPRLTPWQFQYASPNPATEASVDDIFIDIDLPPLPGDQAVITDIAIPILLPDLLNDSDLTPAQYLRDNFQFILDADTIDKTTTLCLVDHTGQILFSTATDSFETDPPSESLEIVERDNPRLPGRCRPDKMTE